ncbi:sigma-54-dependent Fis family transcriptional regulator [Candidatus Dependentiae bacterium]|nr:sigma-54-dependent Fis family transcriptional regulator [Candidatus Dependentiae bacterium]
MKNLLIVDDNKTICDILIKTLSRKEIKIFVESNGEDAISTLKEQEISVVVTDLKLPGKSGLEILDFAMAMESSPEVILITAFGTVETAVQAMKKGAFDFVLKPFELDEIEVKFEKALESWNLKKKNVVLEHENVYLKEQQSERFNFNEIIGVSNAIKAVFELVKKVSQSKTSILIRGETGTGKELIARAIHFNSERKDKPFVRVNCAALAPGVLESELFGHEKGSFTGADYKRIGRFELANEGTIFLDEIGDLPMGTQIKLLRIIQEREFERVGGNKTIKVDVRLIAATNQNLEERIKKRTFREDLFYRINVVPMFVPPLRDRKKDIPLLVKHFLKRFSREMGVEEKSLSDNAIKKLTDYGWKGNIRELENVIERIVVLSQDSFIDINDLPFELQANVMVDLSKLENQTLPELIEEFEKGIISKLLVEENGKKLNVAKRLGIKSSTLYYKIEKLGLSD